jgi:hypothetical protein
VSPGEQTREFYREQGRQDERERILNLLATQWLPIADVEACIALIKGDNA